MLVDERCVRCRRTAVSMARVCARCEAELPEEVARGLLALEAYLAVAAQIDALALERSLWREVG